MKKKAVYLIAITALCVASALFTVACGKSGRAYETTYYGNYGEWFLLPYADSVSVTDADGNAVAVEDGRIFIDRAGNYTLKFTNGNSKQTATLSVGKGREAVIRPSKKIMYAVVGQETDLVTATASDGVGACAVEGKMFFGDEEIDLNEGFTPTRVGVYDYVLSAVTGSGVKTEMTVPYYVELTDNFSDKIASFDKPYGLTQMGFSTRRLSYSQDVAFGDEAGTVALDISSGTITGTTDFCIYNLDCSNVTRYDSIYFYVYNPTPNNLQFYVGWEKGFGLKPKSWTRVSVDKDEYDTVLPGTYPSQSENLTAQDINGMFFSVLLQRDSFVRRGDCLYFSAMRGIKAVDVRTLQATIDAIGTVDAIDQLTVETIDFYYNALRDSQKTQVRGYGAVKNAYEKSRAIAAGLDYRPDKLTYFDTAYGVSQITPNFGVSSFEIDEEKRFDGRPTLKISVGSTNFAFAIKDPFVYDLSEFDVIEVAIYNPTDVTLVFYNKDPLYPGIGTADYELLPNRWNRLLLPVCADRTVDGKTIWVRTADWQGNVMVGKTFYMAPLYAYSMETVFDDFLESGIDDVGYIQTMFAEYTALSAAKKETLKNKTCDVYAHLLERVQSIASQEAFALSVLNMYTTFDAEMKTYFAEHTNLDANFAALYGECVDFVLDRGDFSLHKESVRQLLSIGRVAPDGCADDYSRFVDATVTVKAGDAVIPFDEALDDAQRAGYMRELSNRASSAHTTDMRYGSETGSTVYTLTGDGYCDFGVNVEDVFFSGDETLEFYVYYESADPTFQPEFWYRYYPYGSAVNDNYKACTLTVNGWTKITVSLNGHIQIKDWIFVVMGPSWSNLHQGDRIYFSSVRIAA